MLIDKTHRAWGLASAVLLLLSVGLFVAYARLAPDGPTGGSLPGLLFGIVGSAMMVFAGLLAVRRRLPRWRLGSAQFWLRGHIWLGLLSIVLILFHSGGRLGGPLETALMILSFVVVGSGVYGLVVQQELPRRMMRDVPLETFPQQIGYLCRRLQVQGDLVTAERCGPLAVENAQLRDAAYNLAEARGALRNGKEDEDFQKFLDGIYASRNGIAEKSEPAPGTAAETPEPTAPKVAKAVSPPRGAAVTEGAPAPAARPQTARAMPSTPRPVAAVPSAEPEAEVALVAAAPAAGTAVAGEERPAAKALSPLERARAAGAAKKPGGAPTAETLTDSPAPAPPVTAPAAGPAGAGEKPLSPLERMRAAARAKAAASAPAADSKPEPPADSVASPPAPTQESAVAASPPAAAPAGEGEKPLSPLERMRAAARAKAAASAPAESKSEPPADSVASPPAPTQESAVAASPPAASSAGPAEAGEKPLSPLERMRAAARAKAAASAPADSKAEPSADAAAPPPTTEAAAPKPAAPKPATMPAVPRKTPPVPPVAAAKPSAKRAPAAIARTDVLRRFYLATVRPFLEMPVPRSHPLTQPGQSRQIFLRTRTELSPELHPTLEQLESLCEERRQFVTQLRLHFWLHSWLYLHIPATVALLVLFVAHVVVSLRVVPWAL